MAAREGTDAYLPERALLAAYMGILAGLNAISGALIEEVIQNGLIHAFVTMAGISAGVWFALAAFYLIAREDGQREPAGRSDLFVASGMAMAALLPLSEASSLALFIGGLYYVLSSQPLTRTRRIGIVMLALTGPLVWGKLVLVLFEPSVLSLDGAIVSALSGTGASGNVVNFADGHQFVIGKGCSSVHNLSFALLLWGIVTQLLKLPITARLIRVGILAMAATALVNMLRLVAIALYPADFEYIHMGDGAAMFGWAAVFVASGVIGMGAYVEARRPV